MIDAIILSGGLGTRLQKIVPDLPKALAPIQGTPFLDLLLDQLKKSGMISRITMALGYKADLIVERIKGDPSIEVSIENEPLGTGGALLLALEKTTTDTLFVINGDTFFDIDFKAFYRFHREKSSHLSLAVRFEEKKIARYGSIRFDKQGLVSSFEEKTGSREGGWISGGIYLIEKSALAGFEKNRSYSIEKDFFPALISQKIFAYLSKADFIDIGTPESYARSPSFFHTRISL